MYVAGVAGKDLKVCELQRDFERGPEARGECRKSEVVWTKRRDKKKRLGQRHFMQTALLFHMHSLSLHVLMRHHYSFTGPHSALMWCRDTFTA